MLENKGHEIAKALAKLNCFLVTFDPINDDSSVAKVWNEALTTMEEARSAIEYLMDVLNYISNANDLIGDMNHKQRDFIMSLSNFNSEWNEGETEE